jgi:tetratricopeptide (TPR) repeat protein
VSGAAAALLLTVSVLVHWPFGIAEFVLDDHDFVVLNASIRSFSGAWDVLLEPFPPDQPERGLYRPVTSLSYAIDYAFSGEDARGYHRTNVALYLVVVLLVYRLALTYLATPSFAVAVALVFSLHPVHTGAVDAIAGRSELLALLFGLTSILLFLRAVRSAGSPLWALGGSLLAYALAGLSKETGVVLPGVLAFHVLLFHPPRAKGDQARRDRALRFLAPFAFVLAAYLALRLSVLGRFSPELTALSGEPLVVRLLTMGSVFFENLRLLVYPSVLQVDYYYHDTIGIVSEPSARAILGLAAAALCLALLAAALVRHLRGAPEEAQGDARTRAVAILSLATFAIFLFPVSHVFNINAILAERFLLAPSLGFILLVVLAGRHLLRREVPDLRQRRLVCVLMLGAFAVLGGWRSAVRAAEWRDSVLLWQVTARAIPGNSHIYSDLGGAYLQRGEYTLAQAALERALELDPENVLAVSNLGAVQMQLGDNEGAVATYRRILEEHPGDFFAWNNLGIAEARRQRHTVAMEFFERALRINPNFVPVYNNLRASQQAIADAQRLLAQEGEAGATSSDPLLLERLSAACVAIGDDACASAFAARAAGARSR